MDPLNRLVSSLRFRCGHQGSPFMTPRYSPVSNEHVHAIGRLVVAVSDIDLFVTDLIAVITGAHLLHIITLLHRQSFATKVQRLQALLRLAFDPDNAEDRSSLDPRYLAILDIIGQVSAVNEFRNTVVHSYWHAENGGATYGVQFKPTTKDFRRKVPYTAQQISEQADLADDLVKKVSDLGDEFRAVGAAARGEEE
jgi:hypothetical protein